MLPVKICSELEYGCFMNCMMSFWSWVIQEPHCPLNLVDGKGCDKFCHVLSGEWPHGGSSE